MLLHLVLKYLLENVFDSDILVSLRILFALRNLKYRRAKLLESVILEVFLNLWLQLQEHGVDDPLLAPNDLFILVKFMHFEFALKFAEVVEHDFNFVVESQSHILIRFFLTYHKVFNLLFESALRLGDIDFIGFLVQSLLDTLLVGFQF